MIKRPLLWVLGAYLLGLFLAWYKVPSLILGSIAIIASIFIYFFLYHFPNPFVNRNDKFLWSLPLLIVLGFFSMCSQMARPEFDNTFDEKVNCSLTGKITMIVEKSWGRAFYVTNDTIHLTRGKPYLCENVIVYCMDNQAYQIGNSINVLGTIQKFSPAANPGQFNEQMYYQMENIDYKMMAEVIQITDYNYSKFQAVLSRIKHKLMKVYKSILSEKESGALIAMLLGEKQLLDDEIKQLYQENGIAHILAISGLHVSLIGLTIYMLLKKLKIGIIPATILSIFFIYSYGVLTNFSVSTNRAVVMMIIMMLSKLFGKTYDMLSSMSLSAFIILLQNPMQFFQAGFLLSFGAVLGIAVLIPCLKIIFPSKNQIVEGLFISISAQIITTPVILYYFYQLPVYSLIINLLLLPFMSIEILSALVAGIIGAIYMPIGIFAIGGANYILKFTEWLCRIGSSLPGNLLTTGRPEMFRIFLYTILVTIFVWSVRRYQKKYLVLILAAAFVILLYPRQEHRMEITMLSVGQGDALFMKSETGTTYLFDGGSSDLKNVGVNRIQPFLLSKGVSRIHYAIVSHSDYDHISGLMELMQGSKIKIDQLVLPKIMEKDTSYLNLEKLAREKNIPVLYMSAGNLIKDGPVYMRCLHPSADYEASSTNAYSLVLSISYKEFDMLMTGDLQKDGEDALVQQFQATHKDSGDSAYSTDNSEASYLKDYDILKVAHHGSKYSTYSDLLRIIKPEYSLISCGKNNRYGHPNKELLERLNQIGSNIKITYQTGAIIIKTDGRQLKMREYLND